MRRLSSAIVAVLGSVGFFGCGTAAYPSTLRVSVEDSANVLGAGPVRISVFDANSGDTRDWALKSLGETSPGEPLIAEVSSVETRAGGSGKPAKEVHAGIYVPDYRELGWYELRFTPTDGAETRHELRFIGWDGYEAQAVVVPPLDAVVKARADGKRWDLEVTITLGAERPDESGAVVSHDPLTLELVAAARAGNFDEVKRLLIKGGGINGADGGGQTPLLAATYAGHLEVVRYLLQFGADPNLKDRTGSNALLASAGSVDSLVFVAVLNAGADLTVTDLAGNTALHYAARKGRVDIVRRILATGAATSLLNSTGRSVLHDAASGGCTPGHAESIRLLLAAGASPEVKDLLGKTPLDTAREAGCQATAAVLEERSPR